jgi:putative hemolysin
MDRRARPCSLIEPLLAWLPGEWAQTGSHALAIGIAFIVITALHIVLGELAPKSLALQRSERTALLIVRPLSLFLLVFRPAILFLNGLGNQVLKLAGLRRGSGEESLHSPEELTMLVSASQEAGLLQPTQQEVVARVLNIGERSVSDIMTPRPEVTWIDADDSLEASLRTIRECRHEQVIVSQGSVDEVLGVVRKQDLLDQAVDGEPLDPSTLIQEALVVHEASPVLKVLEHFKRRFVRMAVVVDEYGSLEGIVTQTDLLEAIAGDIPSTEDEEPQVVEREDGSLLIDGMMSANDAFDRLEIQSRPEEGDFHTIAGFAVFQLGRIPTAGDQFSWDGWRFEIVAMDGRRVDRLLVSREDTSAA